MTHLIERFTEILKNGRYNSTTIVAYRKAVFIFFNKYSDYPLHKFTEELVSEYILNLAKTDSPKKATQAGKAIILFFDKIYHRKLNVKATGKFKEEQSIEIFTKAEVKKLLDSSGSLKHTLLLTIIYNNGLKVTEAINLKVEDIDIVRHSITINSDNPEKSRTLRLSPKLNPMIQAYLEKYKPTEAFFPGSGGKGIYSARNIQLVFQKALVKSGIEKKANLTTLRHSFAVHSLETGLSVNLLQKIMGHSNVQTTSVYQQYTNPDIRNIRTPLEDMLEL